MKTLLFTCLVPTILGLGGLTSAAEPPGNAPAPAAAAPAPAASAPLAPTPAPGAPAAAPAPSPSPAPAPVAAPAEPKGAEAGKTSSTPPKPVSGPTCGADASTPMTFCLWSASTPDRNASQTQPEPLSISANDTLYIATVGLPGTPSCAKAKLALNNVLGLDASCMVGPNKDFHYVLQMNDTNLDAWRRFLNRPSSAPITAEVTFSYDNVAFDTAHPFKEQILFTNRYGQWFDGVLAVTTLLVLASFIWLLSTPALCDQPLPQMRVVDCPYSLAKTQMAFWTLLHVAAYMLIMIVTGEMNLLSPSSFVLMGISSATALGAVAVGEMNKNPEIDTAATSLTNLGLVTRNQVDLLWEFVSSTSTPAQPQSVLKEILENYRTTLIARPPVPNGTPPNYQGFTLEQLAEALKKEYENIIKNIKHKNIVRDLVTNGMWEDVLHRWQIVIWTLVLGITFVVKVVIDLKLPNFTEGMLTLMGISGVTYVGFKFKE